MSTKDEITEEWLPVSGYEDIYFISNLGNIKSITRLTKTSNNKIKLIKGVLLKQDEDKNGYSVVSLCKNSKVKIGKIHRLVAEAFIKKPYEGDNFTVNHKDLVKSNNCFTNLEWLSNENNIRHAWDNNAYNKNTTFIVTKNRFTGEIIKYRSIYEAAMFTGVSKKRLYFHLLISKNSGQFHTDEFIFKIDDGTPWPIFLNDPKLCYKFARTIDFMVIDPNDNITIYSSVNLAAARMNIKPNLIKENFLNNDIFVIGPYTFQLLSSVIS